MALSVKEGTRQDTLVKLKNISQAPFPIGYVNIESWRVVPIDPSYECVMSIYYDEETRNNSPEECFHYIIGANIQDSDFSAMTTGDDRQLLYRQLEYIIHYQHYEKTIDMTSIQEVESANVELNNLANDLEIDTLFNLEAQTVEQEK